MKRANTPRQRSNHTHHLKAAAADILPMCFVVKVHTFTKATPEICIGRFGEHDTISLMFRRSSWRISMLVRTAENLQQLLKSGAWHSKKAHFEDCAELFLKSYY